MDDPTLRAHAEREWLQDRAREVLEDARRREATQARASDLLHSVTRDCPEGTPFMRGLAAGIKPFGLAQVREGYMCNADMRVLCLGAAQVTVSGLEELQAADPEQLGYDKGKSLRLLACVELLRHSGDTA